MSYLSRSIQKPFKIVAAMNRNGGIGFQGSIPWKCRSDMKYFKDLTTKTKTVQGTNAVIMGRKTWDSIDGPLANRLNIVITRQERELLPQSQFGPYTFNSLVDAHMWLNDCGDVENQFVIGGASLYDQVIQQNWSSELYLTRIDDSHECDTFFPKIPDYYNPVRSDMLDGAYVTIYQNKYARHYQEQYLYKMRELKNGSCVIGRNGPVYTDFQWPLVVDLQDGLPLFDSRKAFWKGICKELLFFIHGDTNSKHLEDHGIKIWQGNTTRDFLDNRGLDYKEGDMGPMYGWVWRHYGARYMGMDHNYHGEGHDQLRDVIDKLIHDPNNRRILMTSYDPSKVRESVLAPCHSIVNHFYVRTEADGTKYLDMFTYQRSADMFLGVYFNIPSDATLQTIIARAVGMEPGKMHVQFGNVHVYNEHLEALDKQLSRTPGTVFPQLEINKSYKVTDTDTALKWIESLEYEDFKVTGYQPQGHIAAKMIA